MSVNATDLDSSDTADILPQGWRSVPDLTQYILERLRSDSDFVLSRGRYLGTDPISPHSILVLSPVSELPSAATLRRLHQDHAVRSTLDPAHVPQSVCLSHPRTLHPLLILEDEGTVPLDCIADAALEIEQFLKCAISAATAVGHVHGRGLLHKDIKPSNLLVNSARNQVWLTGFGISTRVTRERQAALPPEMMAGTLAYMSPEQSGRVNRSIDSRSDLYGLGITFYQLLTGCLPFTASDPMELLHCHIARKPVPPHERRPGVPRALSAIILKLLAKNAEERYQTATGLLRDLTACLAQWQSQSHIDDFCLGQHDIADRLLIPEKLYGRGPAVAALLNAFGRVLAGNRPELILVSGYSGIGKSSVVSELQRALVPPCGLYASGKFDRYKRDIPYSTLAQAFQELIRTLLSRKDEELSHWRATLKEALGPNAGLIVKLAPELQLIIGEPPVVPDIPLQEAQRRFQLVMRRFIGVFARPEHPLALFLDDLQWLDTATLDVLQDLLIDAELRNLMIIGAYRDNEVDALHPLMQRLGAIRGAGVPIVEIVLAPLAAIDLEGLVADSLHCGKSRAADLAALLHEKTAGNPFFAIQFLTELQEEGLWQFDYGTSAWHWDSDNIQRKALAENVATLLVSKLARLSPPALQMLKLLACVGNSADIGSLKQLSNLSEEDLRGRLQESIQAGLVIQAENSYRFSHDRVTEAAYSLIPKAARIEEHLRIGRLLLSHTALEHREESIFEIVNQFNRGGAGAIETTDERDQVAELCVLAAARAKASSAYQSAVDYLSAGAALLSQHSWEHRRELRFALEISRAECEFLTGHPLDAQQRIVALEGHAEGPVERAAIACLRIDVCTTLNQTAVAVQVVLEYLRAVGIPCAAQPSDQDVKTEYERIRISMGDRDTSAILDEPLLRDPEILGTHDVLTRAIPPAAFIDINLGSLLICKAVNLSLQSGNCDGSCFSYVMLAQMAGPRFGDGSLGFRFGQLGYDLVEKRGLRRYQACTYVAYAIYTARWVVNERFALTVIRRAFEVAHSNAELNFATLCGPVTTASLLFSGDPLADAEQSAHHGLSIAEKAHFPFAADMIVPQLALIRMLRGSPGSFGQLAPFIDERDFTSRLCGNRAYILAEGKYWVRELQAHFFAGQYHEATGLVGKARLATVTAPGAQEHSEFHFYAALAHAACCEPDSNAQNSEHLTALYDHQRQLEVWATYSPVDYENRALLVGAEIARIEGHFLDAEHLFERAIRTSREGGFTHNQAIANERAADFYSKRGLETIARAYLQAAHSCYARWGAQGKVAHLRESHPWLREAERSAGPVDTIDAPAAHLDLAAVTKVLQTVSGEIVLDKLLETFMRTVMENSGADRGLFILSAKTGPRIAAEATTENTIVVKLYDAPADGFTVPESILHSVMRTQSSVILDDAAVQHSFSADPYLGQRRPRSVLCMALSNRGKLIGVLYLENGLAPRVFASGRVAVLTLLASQAAMSLENTRLYRDLAERETKIRHLVDANIVGIETVDLDGLILEANDAFLKIIGYDRDDLDAGRLRWTDLTVTHYQGRDREELLAELQGSGKLHTFEWEYVRKDGTRVPVLSGAATYEGGQRAVGFVLDLTDRKRAELALKQGEAYLAEAQRLTHTGSFAYNYLLGQYTYYSDEQYRIYGHDPQSGQPPSLEDIISRIHPEDRVRLLELIERVVREKCEYTVDFRFALPDGTVRYIHSIGHPVVNDAGVLLEHYGTVVDVTERRRAEQRLLAQHHVTRILAEAATVDEATPAILQAISDFLGCSVARVWGVDRKLNALSHKELWRRPTADSIGSETTAVTNSLERGQGLAGRVWANRAAECISNMDAGALTADAQFSADEGLRTALAFPVLLDSEVLGVVEILSHDVWLPDNDLLVTMTTIGSQIGQFMERKRAENALQSAQSELAYTTRVMTMGELAASIAHEVNQPLGAMVTSAGSAARWLEAQPPDIPKAMRALERIINDGRRAGDVIKRIRGLMKRQAPRKTSLQVNDAIREVIALAQHELRRNEIHLDLQLTEGLPPVQGDKVQLQQVFLNLIVNAIEAMKESKDRPRLLSIVSCMGVPDLLLVEVRDSGVGLSSAHAAHLFEPFYTTKAEGIGIGLSISRSIVEAHGGQLSAGSNSPRGAVFRLSLPVVEPAAH